MRRFFIVVAMVVGLFVSPAVAAADTATPMPPAWTACTPDKQWWGSGTIATYYKGRYGVKAIFKTDPAPAGHCDVKEGGLKWSVRDNGKTLVNFRMYSGERNVWQYRFKRYTGKHTVTYVQTIDGVEYVIDKQVVKTGLKNIVSNDGTIVIPPGVLPGGGSDWSRNATR